MRIFIFAARLVVIKYVCRNFRNRSFTIDFPYLDFIRKLVKKYKIEI